MSQLICPRTALGKSGETAQRVCAYVCDRASTYKILCERVWQVRVILPVQSQYRWMARGRMGGRRQTETDILPQSFMRRWPWRNDSPLTAGGTEEETHKHYLQRYSQTTGNTHGHRSTFWRSGVLGNRTFQRTILNLFQSFFFFKETCWNSAIKCLKTTWPMWGVYLHCPRVFPTMFKPREIHKFAEAKCWVCLMWSPVATSRKGKSLKLTWIKL